MDMTSMKGAIHSLIFTCISFSLVYRFVVADVVVVDDDGGGGGIITVAVDVIQFSLYLTRTGHTYVRYNVHSVKMIIIMFAMFLGQCKRDVINMISLSFAMFKIMSSKMGYCTIE